MTDPGLQEKFQLTRTSSKSTIIRKSKQQTILKVKPTGPAYAIWYAGRDATPKPISPDNYTSGKEKQIYHTTFSMDAGSGSSSDKLLAGVRFTYYQQMLAEGLDEETIYGNSIVRPSDMVGLLEVFQGGSAMSSIVSSASMVSASSREKTEEMEEIISKPEHVTLKLNETNTFFLVDIVSATASKGTDEGHIVEEENRIYEYLTTGKGKYRRMNAGEAQTIQINLKTRGTVCEQIKYKTDYALVNDTVVYDTYKNLGAFGGDVESDVLSTNRLDDMASEDSFKMALEERQIIKLMKNPRFQEAVCVTERLLANNCYNEQQKRFRGLSEPDAFREGIEYKYRLQLLWTFANHDTENRCVTALEWSRENEDLLAVGYGRFYLEDDSTGIVMIWNIKNPVQPERTYKFRPAVNSLSFSHKNPNLLAVGLSDGTVAVLNVVNRDKQIIARNEPSFEQVTHVSWALGTEQRSDKELIFATSSDGRVMTYCTAARDIDQLAAQQIMRVTKAEGKLKGYNPLKICSNLSIPANSYSSALFVTHHPEINTVYFVATNEGIIHKCSVNYLHEHLDLFSAHDGSINAMKFSPFCQHIFATCGDDWSTRIWAEGISEPIHELFVTMRSVQDMDWSPTHSTILATIYANTILLWDFQRKFYEPQSVTKSPAKSRNSIVRFVPSGRCLVVGDTDGNVHVYALEDMPFPPFFPDHQLYEALKKSLITNQPLWKKLKTLFKNKTEDEKVDKSRYSSFGKSEMTLKMWD